MTASWFWERRRSGLALLLIVLVGAALRAVEFPRPHQVIAGDELGYLHGGLELLEGLPPGFKMAPAGPTTWLGWAWAGGMAARHTLIPGPEERAVPLQVRPFIAVNHALFDLYRDATPLRIVLSAVSAIVSIIAIVAAFHLGHYRAGLLGAVFLGGLAAALPLLVSYATFTRSYSLAWSFAIIAWSIAATDTGKRRARLAGIVMGLAIGSRIDMLVLLPVILWEFWDRPEATSGFWRLMGTWVRVTVIMVMTALLVAPWLLTHFIGNLRNIATVRFSAPAFVPPSVSTTMLDFAWTNALLPVLVLFVLGMILVPRPRRMRTWIAALYTLLLLSAIVKGSGFGLRHDAGAVIALMILACVALMSWIARWPRVAAGMVGICLALALGQSTWYVLQRHRTRVIENVTPWIESHVPPGTRVYLMSETTDRVPLPTTESADRLWSEVTNSDAWKKKFESGLKRFNLSVSQMPRALSEENMIQERAGYRGWFILGSRPQLPLPRYDVRISVSLVFGITDWSAELARDGAGGVVVWRGPLDTKPDILGEPLVQWLGAPEDCIYIFGTPDVRAKLAAH
jgi:hypothetical protein